MKNPYVIMVIVIIVAAAIYYFGFHKKKKETNGDAEKSNFGGTMRVVKKPCGCPSKNTFDQNTGTFRNTGIPCNASLPGDVPKNGTIHINGWGVKQCIASQAS